MHYLTFFLFVLSSLHIFSQNEKTEVKTITFYAKDSVKITADTYFIKDVKPIVLLCHQAGYSRGEYINTAKKLNILGFSCMAIDQRSGNEVNDIKNETAIDAKNKNLEINYVNAKQDIEAGINYLYQINGNQPVILVGSSYSASLVLWIGSENKKVKAVAAFSPGEYLKGKNLTKILKALNIPTFVTSSKSETNSVESLLKNVDPALLSHYKPSVKGIHGSRALWETTKGNKEYWLAFKEFMIRNK